MEQVVFGAVICEKKVGRCEVVMDRRSCQEERKVMTTGEPAKAVALLG